MCLFDKEKVDAKGSHYEGERTHRDGSEAQIHPATAGESAVQLRRQYLWQVVPQGVLLLRRIPRSRPKSNRAELRGKICSYAICWEPAFSPLVYALYRPVDTTVHGPDGG